MKKYILVGLCVIFLVMNKFTSADDAELRLEDGTANSGFSVKDDSDNTIARFQGDGNVGIGTASPGANLEVAGDAMITGGLKPDYDSGWMSDSNVSNHETTFQHNLGVFPTRITVWFAANDTPITVYPIIWSWDGTASGNPVTIEMSTTQVIFNIWDGAPLHGVWDGLSATWLKFDAGFWRVFLWK